MFQPLIQLIWKDCLIDLRRKENFLAMFFFSMATLLIFHFSLGNLPIAAQRLAPGMFWVVFLLAGVLGFNKAFTHETETQCLEALLLTPVSRSTILIAKVLSTSLLLFLLQMLMMPIVILLFDLPWPKNMVGWILVGIGGILGLTPLGTLLTAMTARMQGKEMLLPLLLFPMVIPCLICVVKLTEILVFSEEIQSFQSWAILLIAFDVLQGTLCFLAFEWVLEGS